MWLKIKVRLKRLGILKKGVIWTAWKKEICHVKMSHRETTGQRLGLNKRLPMYVLLVVGYMFICYFFELMYPLWPPPSSQENISL